MSDPLTRYRDSYDEFASMLAYAVALIEAQAGHKPSGDRDFYAERIFAKLVCHALSLKRLSPSPRPVSPELWDISSTYAIARTLIETYEALAYVSLEALENNEREFRVLLWKLHAQERRREVLRLIASNHPEVSEVEANLAELRQPVLDHPFMQSSGADLARKVRRGEPPPYHLSRAERDARSGIDGDYHTVVIMHLSSHVHTHPFSVHQLLEFHAGDPECLRLMAIPLQYSLAFLAKALIGIRELFSPRVPSASPELVQSLGVWEGVLRKGVKRAG